MKILRLVLAFGLMLFAVAGSPQDRNSFPIIADFDADSTTMTYVLFDPPRSGTANIKTTGSSATVDAASGTPFAAVAVGDEIFVRDVDATAQVRYVRAKASSIQITVNAAVNWSGNGSTGYGFTYRTFRSGTGADAGWFQVGGAFSRRNIYFGLEQVNATGGVAFQIDCIMGAPAAKPTLVYPPGGSTACETGTLTTAPTRCLVVLSLGAQRCRLGAKIVTADDGDDLTTNREDVHAEFMGEPK